ncbi:RNA recognition motif containing protein [Drechmeria coniospora]|uniref:RNA recognition motif containing protein n=1 Tax=Drechmeria coniospora TaxID=98403 RepID=A0A151GXQ3_DRECN|nr:RNA recognition motif containing protein [Drechmeria coniospora]KYK61851.1 RNA recognition motif containing protein [Drechmeria coniospora]
MAPKKKEQQKMSLGDFLTDSGFGGGSWADEVEETYVTVGTQQLPASDRSRPGGTHSAWQERGYSVREETPQTLPTKPPFTAHLGNLSYDATSETVTEFFEGCSVVSVRIIEDRELMRPKGFGYVEFADVDGLKKALTLDGESFQDRMIRIKIADPPRGGDSRGGESTRDLSDWSRKGPLPDLPGRGSRQPSDFGERRPRDPAFSESRPAREINWERKGPLAPIPGQEYAPGPRDRSRSRATPEGMGDRSERGSRSGAGAWGEGRQEGSRPPRRDQPERAERVVTAAEKDFQWRERMRPDAPAKPEATSHDGSEAPPSPALSTAAPAQGGRPRLNLAKRTVSEAANAAAAAPAGDSKASPFGAARPIDTASKEKEIEEKRLQVLQEKREAEEKAKEERRLAKQAAAAAAEVDAPAKVEEDAKAEDNDKADEGAKVDEKVAEAKEGSEPAEKQNGTPAEQKVPIRSREPKENAPSFKSRATEGGSWRSAPNEQRANRGGGPGGARGGRGGGRGDRADGAGRGSRNEGRGARANGSPGQQQAPAPAATDAEPSTDADGWTTVPNKKGRQGRP